MREHKKWEEAQGKCGLCMDNPHFRKHLMVALGAFYPRMNEYEQCVVFGRNQPNTTHPQNTNPPPPKKNKTGEHALLLYRTPTGAGSGNGVAALVPGHVAIVPVKHAEAVTAL